MPTCALVKDSAESGKGLAKSLRKLYKSMLKEDRNNAGLVAKIAQIEYRMGPAVGGGYTQAHNILDSGLAGLSKEQLQGRIFSNIQVKEQVILVPEPAKATRTQSFEHFE